MIHICPEQGNEGIITAITVVGETVTVYCGERTVEYITWAEMAKSRTRSLVLGTGSFQRLSKDEGAIPK